jgi:hypothetical protein
MGPYPHPRVFGSLDLEIIDRVYDAAWAELEAREATAAAAWQKSPSVGSAFRLGTLRHPGGLRTRCP